MNLTSMRYKDYTWPHNPRVYSITYERKVAPHKIPFGRYQMQDMGRTFRVISGEGEFVGEDAYKQFGALVSTFYNAGPGTLSHPVWQATTAYFVELTLKQEPRPDYVNYSFTFWEDCDKCAATLKAVKAVTQSETVVAKANQTVHTVVKGETLWAIARSYNTTVAALVALNSIKNPNLIAVGQRVQVTG